MTEKFQPFKQPRFSYEFLKFLNKFILETALFSHDSKIVIALSGGVDSVVLTQAISLSLKMGLIKLTHRPRLIHIDHGTRKEIKKEVDYLYEWSKHLEMSFESHSLKMDLSQGNFEKIARDERRRIFKQKMSDDEILLMGHHIDDSFEWSLMQKLKSSNLEASLGIAVRSQNIRRPLMCMSKKHILRFAKEQNLTWFEDSSNKNLNFERNYLRNLINKQIAPRFPQYLKHYVRQHNELARRANKSAFKIELAKDFHQKSSKSYARLILKTHKREWGAVVTLNPRVTISSDNLGPLRNLISQYSQVERGKIHNQLIELAKLIQRPGLNGPLSFSGGLKVYCTSRYLFILKPDHEIQLFSKQSVSQIPDPVPFISRASKQKESLKSAIAMVERQSQELLDERVLFHFAWRLENGPVLFWI